MALPLVKVTLAVSHRDRWYHRWDGGIKGTENQGNSDPGLSTSFLIFIFFFIQTLSGFHKTSLMYFQRQCPKLTSYEVSQLCNTTMLGKTSFPKHRHLRATSHHILTIAEKTALVSYETHAGLSDGGLLEGLFPQYSLSPLLDHIYHRVLLPSEH